MEAGVEIVGGQGCLDCLSVPPGKEKHAGERESVLVLVQSVHRTARWPSSAQLLASAGGCEDHQRTAGPLQ